MGRPTGRKTRFWLLAKLYRAGLVTRRVPTKGFRDAFLHLFPLSQAFLAQDASLVLAHTKVAASYSFAPACFSRAIIGSFFAGDAVWFVLAQKNKGAGSLYC